MSFFLDFGPTCGPANFDVADPSLLIMANQRKIFYRIMKITDLKSGEEKSVNERENRENVRKVGKKIKPRKYWIGKKIIRIWESTLPTF